VIRLTVRRFFCPVPACKRRTFAEQVPGLTVPYGRKTAPLAGALKGIAVALAGRAASRLAAALGMPASRQALLRLVMAAHDPAAGEPRVVGIDDFAIRRGQNYGTVIIDCETGAPLDLLEGRDGQPLADWLADHPGVKIIARDRASAYTEGARTGHRTPSRSPTGSTCGRTSPKRSRSASPRTAPAWRSQPRKRKRPKT
jgi:transposase